MNNSTAKRLRRLVRQTSTNPDKDTARYERLKSDWLKTPVPQRATLLDSLEAVAQMMSAMTPAQRGTAMHLAIQGQSAAADSTNAVRA